MKIVTEIPNTGGLFDLFMIFILSLSFFYVGFIVYAIVFDEILQGIFKYLKDRRSQ